MTQFSELMRKLDHIHRHVRRLMATKEEVQADIADIKTSVAETRGAVNSALKLLHDVMDRVGTAAATATDLDGLRTDLALIKTEVQAATSDLKAAVVENPAPGEVIPPTEPVA